MIVPARAATCSALADRLGVERGGSLSRNLAELCEAGFIAKDDNVNPATGRKSKLARYRVGDNYTRFYLKYVMPRKTQIESGSFRFASLGTLPEWNAVMGLQFENLIVNNAMEVVRFLGIGNSTVESAAPYRNVRKSRNGGAAGCQIDLLVQTPRTAYVVEVKRCNRIDTSIEQEIEEKVSRLGIGSEKSVRTVLVYDGKLSPEVEENGFIDFLVPFSGLVNASTGGI